MKYSEVVQLERLLEKYRDTYASKTMKNKIDFLIKQVSKKAEELKDPDYRFFVCKKGTRFGADNQEYIPVTDPFMTLADANKWMREHGPATQEILFSIKAPKDMWDEEDIERIA